MIQSRSGRGATIVMATMMLLLLCFPWSYTSAFSVPTPTRIPQFTDLKRFRQPVSQHYTSNQIHDDITAPSTFRSQWRQCRQRISLRMNRKSRPGYNRKSLFAAALALVSLLKPKRVLAAMGGGMGGSKGPIAPMAR